MATLLYFFTGVAAQLLDPISLIGYVLAGSLIRHYWVAVAVGVVWRLLLHLIMATLFAPALHESIPAHILGAALFGAFTATSLVYLVAYIFRERPAEDNLME